MEVRLFHDGRDRESMLIPMSHDNAELMLQFRIQLVRCEPTTTFNVGGTFCRGNGILHDEFGRFNLDPWTEREWQEYSTNFLDIIRRYWDSKFELTPNRPWLPPRTGAAPAAAKINCSLSLGLADTRSQANQTYHIVKPRQTGFRSFAMPERRRGLFTHRDLALEWNTRMTRIGGERHSVSFLQCTVLHEFGHTLGLHHVRGEGNNDANYGLTLEQRQDLMGLGHNAAPQSARPWIRQLRHHLIRGRREEPVNFTARVTAPQLITYWDNDWRPAPAAAAPAPAGP